MIFLSYSKYPHCVSLKNDGPQEISQRVIDAIYWLRKQGYKNGVHWDVILIGTLNGKSLFWFKDEKVALHFKLVHT